jgi:hypothetical protein
MTGRNLTGSSGFNIGAIGSAVLLAFGIESIFAMVEGPLSAALIAALNWVIRTGRFDVMPMQPVPYSGIIVTYAGLSGVILLISGVTLAAWVGKSA